MVNHKKEDVGIAVANTRTMTLAETHIIDHLSQEEGEEENVL